MFAASVTGCLGRRCNNLLNEKGVSFVSVTQHFSTTDPTGRMFLGILITFVRYERQVITEGTRDKVQAIHQGCSFLDELLTWPGENRESGVKQKKDGRGMGRSDGAERCFVKM
ncbi:MAG: recombinase family protein [Desulfobacteraceae bacterium]|nr:recombinase family protein [Desulfobacteraceae bacterium]